jgi:hypothetical protein
MKATILRNAAIFTTLATCIGAGITGKLPWGEKVMPDLLSKVDQSSFQWAVYPVATAFFIGLMVAWVIYIAVSWFAVWRFQWNLEALADLRPLGTQIRIDGMALTQIDDVAPWVARVQEWNGSVIRAIKKISRPDSKRFATLGYPGNVRPHGQIAWLTDKHRQMFFNHDCREQLLDKFYDKYSAKQ